MSEEIKNENLTQIRGGVETLIDDPNWKTYKIMRKMATGRGVHNEVIDLRNYSNGVSWRNTKICVGLDKIKLSNNTTTIVSKYIKLDDNSFKIIAYTDNTIYTQTINESIAHRGGTRVLEYKGTDFYVRYNDERTWKSSYLQVERAFGKSGTWESYVLVYNVPSGSNSIAGKDEEFHFNGEYDSIRFRLTAGGREPKLLFDINGGIRSTEPDISSNTVEWLAYEE